MARTKEFDREQVLEKAMNLFWRCGYEATSMDALLHSMGIARQSLYDTFGDKHALFLAALERYMARRDGEASSTLASAHSAKRAIRDIFMAIVSESTAEKKRGCFGVNSAIELAPHDADVARLIAIRQRSVEEAFFRALERAREQGEISPKKDTRALARFLLGALQGLRVSAKADPHSPALVDIAEIALQTLD